MMFLCTHIVKSESKGYKINAQRTLAHKRGLVIRRLIAFCFIQRDGTTTIYHWANCIHHPCNRIPSQALAHPIDRLEHCEAHSSTRASLPPAHLFTVNDPGRRYAVSGASCWMLKNYIDLGMFKLVIFSSKVEYAFKEIVFRFSSSNSIDISFKQLAIFIKILSLEICR